MQDCWLRVRNDEGRWEDRAGFLADDEAEALRVAREIVPEGEIEVRFGERKIAG